MAPPRRFARSLLLLLGAAGCLAPPPDWESRAAARAAEAAARPEPVEVVEASAPARPEVLEVLEVPPAPPPELEEVALPDDARTFVWIIGRPAVPGLPEERRTAREREREEVLAGVAAGLASNPAWSELLRDELEAAPEDASGDRAWAATANAVARLRVFELAPSLAAALEGDARPARRRSAREALHLLAGVWFEGTADAEDFLDSLEASGGVAKLVEHLLDEERRANASRLGLIAVEPERAVELFASPDAAVRAGAARAVGDATFRGRLDRAAALDLVLPALAAEHAPEAAAAQADAASVAIGGAPAGDPGVARVRALLRARFVDRTFPDDLTLTRSFAGLPWEVDGSGDGEASLVAGIELCTRLLARHASDPDSRQRDPEVLAEILVSVGALCERAAEPDAGAQAKRLRASDALLPVAALLHDAELAPAVAHAALGVLTAFLGLAEPTDESARAVTAAIAAAAGAGDADVRRYATALLASSALEPFARELDPQVFLARLGHESVEDLRELLLHLVRRFGGAEEFDALLALPSFDSLAAGAPPTRLALADALDHLAEERPGRLFAAARALAGAEEEPGAVDRQRRALELAARLDGESASKLSPAEHADVVRWAARLRDAGVKLDEALPDGSAFERRLVDVHLPGAEAGDGPALAPLRAGHLEALFLGDVIAAGAGDADDVGRVEAAYARVLDEAAGGGDARLEELVRRDRARFFAASGDPVRALVDYRALLESEVLEPEDLRAASALIASTGSAGPAGRRATAPEAFDLVRRVVRQSDWAAEPAGVRFQDLIDLGGFALASEHRDRVADFVDLVDGMPDEVATGVGVGVWRGLEDEIASHAELLDLRERARALLAILSRSDEG